MTSPLPESSSLLANVPQDIIVVYNFKNANDCNLTAPFTLQQEVPIGTATTNVAGWRKEGSESDVRLASVVLTSAYVSRALSQEPHASNYGATSHCALVIVVAENAICDLLSVTLILITPLMNKYCCAEPRDSPSRVRLFGLGSNHSKFDIHTYIHI